MWYQLYIDYKKVEYKISEAKDSFKYHISIIEEKAKDNPTICMEAIFHNENYYYSKSIEALKRKVVELGWIYSHQLDSSISEENVLVSHLDAELKKLNQSIESKKNLRLNVLKEFSNHVSDYKELLISNISKIHTTEKGIERIKNNLNIDIYNLNLLMDYCRDIILSKNSYVYEKNKNLYVVKDNIRLTINLRSYTIITAHLIK